MDNWIMKRNKSLSLAILTTLHTATAITVQADTNLTSPKNADDWYQQGKQAVEDNLNITRKAHDNARQRAKNVIVFVADGMGISTQTAARIYEGQQLGLEGEEHALFFETFPHLALSKTYNTNQQTPDSAGTMTAITTGVKTKAGLISVNQNTTRGDCDSQKGNELTTSLELAEIIGMSTGVVTTARLTHATPAATYAHSMDRNFEDDRDASKFSNPGDCPDIARQLIEFPDRFKDQYPWVNGLEVALGGGRRNFIERIEGIDPEDGGRGERTDGRDLTAEWTSKYQNAQYVWNKSQFDVISTDKVDHLLGLFDMSHMAYELDRETDAGKEPSLSDMTKTAIDILNNNPKGFLLHVEAGRIDHAHHATNPKRALQDTVEFANAIKTAYDNTDPDDTLIIVTADHSHVFTIGGYPTRGNPILGKVISNDSAGNPEQSKTMAADGLPYSTLSYTNGRGFHLLPKGGDTIYDEDINHGGRSDLTNVDTTDQGFHPEVVVPLSSETHAAEDVAIYATGPGSALVSGLLEQNAIYHIVNKAARLEKRAKREGWSRY
jgi:alkaline phosphatase